MARRRKTATSKERLADRRPRRDEAPARPWALGAILACAFLARIAGLSDDFPIVGDESIYLRWAEIIDNQGQWFISLLDGKQPLSYWLYAVTRFLWEGDPLLAGRLISALAGTAATFGIYRIGDRLAGRRAGLLAAAFYAALPWAILYDRLMYTEALLNLSGVAIVYAALVAFDRDRPEPRLDLLAGLALGLGFFVKSTALLFAHFPLLAGIFFARRNPKRLAARLALIYGIAAIFPLFSAMTTPAAPRLESHDVIFHKTHFFVAPADLVADPFGALGENLPALAEFTGAYLTWPAFVGCAAAALWLIGRRERAAWLLLSVSAAPIALTSVMLTRFYSRYPFPHVWGLLVVAAIAAARLIESDKKTYGYVLAALIAAPLVVQSLAIHLNPARALAESDAGYYFTDRPNAGFGVRSVVRHLLAEAEKGPLLLLTDPIWGTPADAMFPYLNKRKGIRVQEGWWIEDDPRGPLLPGAGAELWRSHYERTPGGRISWNDFRAIYYVTLTNYHSRESIRARQPGAELELSIAKPGGREALDLYRLR